MKKQELAKNIMHYRFDPRPEREWDTSAVVILDGSKAILIDTGYESQIPLLLDDLASNNIEVEAVIISHFHDDHMEGLKLLPGVPVYGSNRFQDALDKWIPEESHKYFNPAILIDALKIIKFGEHTITLIPSPGHSECTVLVKINDQFLHVADEIIFSADGRLSLPAVDCKSDMPRQIKSFEALKDYSGFTIIPAHGPAFCGDRLENVIQNLSRYMNAVLESDGEITYEDATKDCDCDFANKNWHEGNCE